jgi:hypothetical protein
VLIRKFATRSRTALNNPDSKFSGTVAVSVEFAGVSCAPSRMDAAVAMGSGCGFVRLASSMHRFVYSCDAGAG